MQFFKNKKNLLKLIFCIVFIGTVGSLYYSTFGDPLKNIADGVLFDSFRALIPCKLCWWARIFLYPITIISGLALYRKEYSMFPYIFALAIPGALVTGYHSLLQWGIVKVIVPCTVGVPCELATVKYLGFVTIPFLGFVAFGATVILGVLSFRKN